MSGIRKTARELHGMGFALCRLIPREKNPLSEGYNRAGCDIDDFLDDDNIGILCGALSGNLVCVDIDSLKAREIAHLYMPPTDMKDSRPNEKHPTHYWYIVTNIPPHLTAGKMKVAGDLGGPKTLRFKKPDEEMQVKSSDTDGNGVPPKKKPPKKTQVEILGTGGYAAVPPSLIERKDDETEYENRVWREKLGKPAVIDAQTLYNCVRTLALACGFVGYDRVTPPELRPKKAVDRKTKESLGKESHDSDEPLPPVPTSEKAHRARTYIAKIKGSVIGDDGNGHTFHVACVLINYFGLSVEEAFPLFCEWNQKKCEKPWYQHQLRGYLERAVGIPTEIRPELCVKPDLSNYDIDLRHDDPTITVGVDCASEDWNYVSMERMTAAIRHIRGYNTVVLAPRLAEIKWSGREVHIWPPSTIITNCQHLEAEYYLYHLLTQQCGTSKVICHRLPPFGEHKRQNTLTKSLAAGVEVDWDVTVMPPANKVELEKAMEEAKKLARAVDLERKTAPRNKKSLQLEKAKMFLKSKNADKVTNEFVKEASDCFGLRERTLRNAMSLLILQDEDNKRGNKEGSSILQLEKLLTANSSRQRAMANHPRRSRQPQDERDS